MRDFGVNLTIIELGLIKLDMIKIGVIFSVNLFLK